MAVLFLLAGVVVLVFGNVILNQYGRGKAERAFANAHPGSALRIGELDYTMGANRLTAQSITLSSIGTMFKTGRISLTGVRWTRLLKNRYALADVLAQAGLEATDVHVEFPDSHYGVRCAQLLASVSRSELTAEGIELQPLIQDEAFFAADAFRTRRFRAVLPECQVSGLEYAEALKGTAFRAQSIRFDRPFFEALINRDKLPKPSVNNPPMLHEALAGIPQAILVGSLSITNGTVKYCERLSVGTKPAELTFGTVSLSAEGIANQGQATDAIQVRGQGRLMNSGMMKVAMSIPINAPDFSLHYSGSLDAMDLRHLDAFLEISERTRIKSGLAEAASFQIDVTQGHARGRVQGIYKNLEIALLDKQTGERKGLNNRVTSFFANLKIRNANTPGMLGGLKEGKINYTRKPDDEFMQFVWFALRTGVLDIISH